MCFKNQLSPHQTEYWPFVLFETDVHVEESIQYNLNGSNKDGSFTVDVQTFFSVSTKSFQ